MNKIKVTSKSGVSQLIIKSLKGQQLSGNEVYDINSNKVEGLLHLDVIPKGSLFKLVFNVTGLITLKDFLRDTLNKQAFADILNNILANLKAVDSAFFNQDSLILDINRVFVNPATRDIYFVYVPIQFYESGFSLRELLLDIIQYGAFESGEDNSYVKDYITILNNGINFSVFELEQYVIRLSGSEQDTEIECPNCKAKINKSIGYCNNCGIKVSGSIGNFGKKVYDPLNDYADGLNTLDNNYVSDRNSSNLNNYYTKTLSSENPEEYAVAYIVREKTKERIKITKPSFKIGSKTAFVDYCISDNTTISRMHAEIVFKNNKYYIVDLNSTNKTFVDGRVIPSSKEIELFSGVRIRLSNECFSFYVKP